MAATIHGLLRYYRERHEGGAVKPVYESFEQCSAALEISVEQLKRAKRKGCPALRYNRVQLKAYLRWRFAAENREPVAFDRGRIERVRLKNAKLRIELQKLRRELIPADIVRRMGAELGHVIRTKVLRLHLLTMVLVGQPVEVIEQRLRDAQEEILESIDFIPRRLDEWKAKAAR